MKIQLLYFEGCPNYAAFLPQQSELIASEGIEEEAWIRAALRRAR
ncbi:MAG TPA: hypothetical protein VFN72_10990 [Solirubrobacterales bacterium]|nr:hypothetical protein [Solirubrobacterales bacterium]